MKKKIFFTPLFLVATFSLGTITPRTKIEEKNVQNLNNINQLWGQKVSDYYNRDYSAKRNSTVTGKYYKVGIMGHRQQIKFGEIKMVVAEVEQYISSRSVGTFTNITFEENYSYTLTEQITASASVKYGIIDMVSATINLEDVGSVGTSTSNTREYSFGLEVMYGKTLQKGYKINSNINIESIPSDKKTFSVSRVSCYLECEVKYSYTQEQNMFGKWKTIGGTTKSNYTCRYYIADVTTFCYNDNTFGDTSMGIYKLDLVKEY